MAEQTEPERLPSAPAIPCFVGAGRWELARSVLFGAPLDVTVTFRPGSRFGPSTIRAVSPVLEEWSPVLSRGFGERPFHDAGDLELIPGDVSAALRSIEEVVGTIAGANRRPIMLGGEHLVTIAAIRGLAPRYPGLCVIQFDAHADLRGDYMGLTLSHATVMRRVAEVVGPKNLYQVGIRSGTAEEWEYAHDATHMHPYDVQLPVAWRDVLCEHPVYVTVDVDSVDPAFAPGTGTPEPGGPSAMDLLRAIDALDGLRLIGADVVEVAPAYDLSGRTAVLAAKLVRELLLIS